MRFHSCLTDISKYFDRIWRFVLLYKCKNDFGITGTLYKWLNSYLQDRKQRVSINDSFSSVKIINAGCQQGSELGPIVALLYLDDLSNKTQHGICRWHITLSFSHLRPKHDPTSTSTRFESILSVWKTVGNYIQCCENYTTNILPKKGQSTTGTNFWRHFNTMS